MAKRTFVGTSLCGGFGGDSEKIFQSGHVRVLIKCGGIPARISNALVRGGTYLVSYVTEDIVSEEGKDILVKKGDVEKI